MPAKGNGRTRRRLWTCPSSVDKRRRPLSLGPGTSRDTTAAPTSQPREDRGVGFSFQRQERRRRMRSMISRKLFAGLTVTGLLAAPMFAVAGPTETAIRPYLGMAAEALGKDATPNGVTVHSVNPDGPADKAGLKSSDRIVMADGKEVKTFEDLKNTLAGRKPGEQVALKVMRDSAEQTVTVTLGDAPKNRDSAEPPAQPTGMFLGVFTQSLSAELRERLGVTADKGAVVSHVVPGSPAAK